MSSDHWPAHERTARVWRPGSIRSSRSERRVEYDISTPPRIADLTVRIPASISGAAEAVGLRLRDLARLPHLDAMILPLLRTEATASSRIELIDVQQRQMALAMAGAEAKRNAEQVVDNVLAMHSAVEIEQGSTLTVEDVHRVHRRLLPDEGFAGQIRRRQSWIGGSDMSPRGALYVPPEPGDVDPLFEDLLGFVNDGPYPGLITAAVAHAQFESIHPYLDGNGRVGRALVHMVLRRQGLLDETAPPLSLILLSDRQRYFDGLGAYRAGDVWTWVREFLSAVRASVDLAERLAEELLALQRAWAELPTVARTRADATVRDLVDQLVAHPVMTVSSVAEALTVSKPTARSALKLLEDAGVLTRTPTRGRADVWEARETFEVLDAVEAEAAWPASE